MERISGIPVSDIKQLQAQDINLERIIPQGCGNIFHPGISTQLLPRRHAPR